MAKTVSEGFQTFLGWIEPLSSERNKATSHRDSVKACLANNFECYDFKETGSFGNGTGIRHYSDVDYFAAIPTKKMAEDSAYFLRKVKDALKSTFWSTGGIEVNSPAVVIPFGKYASEDLEVTPCSYSGMSTTALGSFPRYEIPDGDGGWMFSSPQAHNAYVRSIDEKLRGKLKPLIKFVKAWKFMNEVPIISFHIELRVTRFLSNSSIIFSYDEALSNIFAELYRLQLASMQDPMGISGLIPASKTPTQKAAALSKLETAAIRSEKAYNARIRGNENDAFYYWNLLFNKQFPAR
ncbi:MAG: SMODS domain-containing nucleotidyltransferase [Bacteroidia bacterium]